MFEILLYSGMALIIGGFCLLLMNDHIVIKWEYSGKVIICNMDFILFFACFFSVFGLWIV